ncbi:hypothetical protein ASE80_23780 [Pseudomonas sp. Leaf15]|uniref:hypothetical protein n=1 Tax=unclassified Pseudomonas TaxID=196821 RepID=UPI0007030FBC|nr:MULTISPECIES: hypothetical protein [unclassified Pseudomonas]KQM54116.1 hypothetical protein ASE80_23780 [Pseudomonas sp. Leaf15]RAG99511.1 hypothetical protein DJ480_27295 [Pseudomonas sp. Leaf98]
MSTPPDSFDTLDVGPYPAEPGVDLSKTMYKELASIGLGRNEILPICYWVFEPWTKWASLDRCIVQLGLPNPLKADALTVDRQDRYHVGFDGYKIPEGNLRFFGQVIRAGSQQEARSDEGLIFCKQSIPGGNDPNPGEPWHSGLLMKVIEVLEDGKIIDFPEGKSIDATRAKDGLWIWVYPYSDIRQNDRNIFYFGTFSYTHTVSPQEASQKGGYAVFIPYKDYLEKLPKRGTFTICMGVKDVVENEPQGAYTLSKPYMLRSEIDPNLLNAPRVVKYGDDITIVDLDVPFDAEVIVLIQPPKSKPAPRPLNNIVLVVEASPEGGSPVITRFAPITDKNYESETIPLPGKFFHDIGRGTVRLWWEWTTSAGVVIKESGSYLVHITGTPTRMPALKLLHPFNAGMISPGVDGPVEVLKYSPYSAKNIEVILAKQQIGQNGAKFVTLSKQPAGPEGGKQALPEKLLRQFDGLGKFDIILEVRMQDGSSPRQSEAVVAEVGKAVPVLPEVYIKEAKKYYGNWNLDLKDLNGYSVGVYFTYFNTKAGDKIVLTIAGDSPRNFLQIEIDIFEDIAGAALLELETPIDQAFIELNFGKSLNIYYSVESPGSPPVILRSEVLKLSIGEPVNLESFQLLEANATAMTINPVAVINGANGEVRYSQAAKGDRLLISWLGQYGISQHKQEIKVDPKLGVFTFKIPDEVIALALRRDGNNILLNCTLLRGPFSYAFEPLQLLLLPFDALPRPYISNYAHTTVLPVYELDVPRWIIDIWKFASLGQFMFMTITGEFADGGIYENKIFTPNEVIAEHLVKGVSVPLAMDKIRLLKDGSPLKISFSVSFVKIPLMQTAVPFGETVYVIQQLPAELAFPTLIGAATIAQETTVDPLSIEKNVSVKVAYKGMLDTDEIECEWILQNGTVFIEKVKGKASGSVIVDFTKWQALHNSVNSRVQLIYSVKRGDKTTFSAVQTVMVNAIAAASLPRPMINNQATGTAVDLNTFVGNARLDLARIPLCKAGQLIWIDFVGGGRTVEVLPVHEITEAEVVSGFVNLPVLRGLLSVLAQGATFQIVVRIAYYGDVEKSRAFVFPLVQYVKSDSFAASTTSFMYGLGPWSPGVNADRYFFSGVGLNIPTYADRAGYKGVVIATYATFYVGHRYRASFNIYNNTKTDAGRLLDPILAITLGGAQVSAAISPPRDNWYFLTIDFTVSANATQAVALHNYQDSGWGSDFIVHSAYLSRLT